MEHGETPYLIQSIEDLVAFANNVNGGNAYTNNYVRLEKTLDFSSDLSYIDPNDTAFGDINGNSITEGLKIELTTAKGFMPIGNAVENAFAGTFEGQNNEIRNIYINKQLSGYYACMSLFGIISGTVKDLGVSGEIQGDDNAAIAGIVGDNKEGLITNCLSNVTLSGSMISVGGIVARNSGVVSDCTNKGNIQTLDCSGIGGIAMFNDDRYVLDQAQIINCTNRGNIVAEFTEGFGNNIFIGGIAGCMYGSILMDRCINEGSISLTVGIEGLVTPSEGWSYVGGIAAEIIDEAIITNSTNKGPITAENTILDIGGITGWCGGTVDKCINIGNLTSITNNIGLVGGISAGNWGTVSNCINRGAVPEGEAEIVNENGGTVTNCTSE